MRALPPLSRDEFARRGFVVLRAPIISRDYCDLLNARLEKLLRGSRERRLLTDGHDTLPEWGSCRSLGHAECFPRS